MMKFTAVYTLLAALPLLAAAWNQPTPTTTVTVTASPTATPASQCSTGDLQCCNSVEQSTDPDAADALSLLGVVVEGVNVLVGLTCSPISVVGITGASW